MPPPTPAELKKALTAEGFEIYRTTGDRILLADRVRDNLIMDSGVSVRPDGGGYLVACIVRLQKSDFPSETDEQLFGRARRLGDSAVARGYTEVSTNAVPVADPGDSTRTLDVWYEVAFERGVPAGEDLYEELRELLKLPKTATR
jgi:hypothetical protein